MISYRFSIGFKSGHWAGHIQNLNSFIVETILDTFGSVTRVLVDGEMLGKGERHAVEGGSGTHFR